MITITASCLGILISINNLNNNNFWNVIVSQTTILFFISTILIINPNSTWNPSNLSYNLSIDNINICLIILSLWLVPVSILASIGHLNNSPLNQNKIFSSLIIFILISLVIMFSTNNILILFIGFETTLAPTLFLISRWGNQPERIEAGYYFVFYTLISSLPLLIALLFIYNNFNHLSVSLFNFNPLNNSNYLLTILCLIAFIVKVPIFSVHLWLPKAHVEAPVAGSMILAAILLKMGGYGFIRLTLIFQYNIINNLTPFILPYCCWGGALASIICLTQTDLKSLIAYSSVSHMSFMIAGITLLTNWGLNGGIFMMIAHGITSSALFAIANINYERTNTRTLNISRNIKASTILLPIIWLIFSCANLGLPPLPNAIAEIFIFSSIISFSLINIVSIITTTILTAIFSLTVFQLLNSGNTFNWNLISYKTNEREYLTLSLHLIPLITLVCNPNILAL
uniref:NADH-ubiquinone oxidoreductase chain 4 n=1 Tax=Ophiacantha linea TaxID=1357420 RepID=V9NK61_9ECHI|nr:NADH dehydrogenase subunit 4 [Ophiacantha linea]AGQ49784.1 NADH dehydrogenase subunit 4 [Ophiacantha linea]